MRMIRLTLRAGRVTDVDALVSGPDGRLGWAWDEASQVIDWADGEVLRLADEMGLVALDVVCCGEKRALVVAPAAEFNARVAAERAGPFYVPVPVIVILAGLNFWEWRRLPSRAAVRACMQEFKQ